MNIQGRKSAALVAAVLVSGGLAPAAAADELSELRSAVEALQRRIDQLESRAQSTEETNDRQTDQIAIARSNVGSWVSNFTWKGDFRYRNETIDQEHVAKDRNRDRIRARAGFTAKVNDTVRTEFMLATTENNDPRSSNQTLTGENSRKSISLDMAYVEWAPNAQWKLTAGKMRYPWVRPGQSVLFDGDINPEGLAVNFTRGDVFASTFYNLLEERASAAESTMFGGQAGWRPSVGGGRLTLAASWFAFSGVQGRNPFYNASSNGNSTTSVTGNCVTATPCLAQDFGIWEVFADWTRPVAGRPLGLYFDYFRNTEAQNGLDTAWSAGVVYGRASDPRTWEIGYYYQAVEKDALFAQFIDSDFGAGNTDSQGGVIKLGYAPARNWTLNGTYMINETNVDVPVTIAGVGPVTRRDYNRLQLDLNFRY